MIKRIRITQSMCPYDMYFNVTDNNVNVKDSIIDTIREFAKTEMGQTALRLYHGEMRWEDVYTYCTDEMYNKHGLVPCDPFIGYIKDDPHGNIPVECEIPGSVRIL